MTSHTTPTPGQLRSEAANLLQKADALEDDDSKRTAGRDDAIATIGWLKSRLQEHGLGFTRWREGELVDPDTNWIVRTGYANQECEVELRPVPADRGGPVAPEFHHIRLRLYAGVGGQEAMRLECHRLLAQIGVEL